MASPDEVRASLLSAGDHGRDGVARRKVADQVAVAAVHAAGSAIDPVVDVVKRAINGNDMEPARAEVRARLREAATAASAVVLASDLRAPGDPREAYPLYVFEDGSIRPVVEDFHDRLANVERLLAVADYGHAELCEKDVNLGTSCDCGNDQLAEALAIVRSLLGGA